MAKIQDSAARKVAKNAEQIQKEIFKPRRPRKSRLKVSKWSDGLDERIVAYILENKIPPSRVRVVSKTEVIIDN